MEGDRAQAEQRFAEYRQQEDFQREIDKGILSRLMCEAQERYQLLQGQLTNMAQECQHEIANKDVAWRQEYGKLQSVADHIFEEARA